MQLTPWEFNRMVEGFRLSQGEDPKDVFRVAVPMDEIKERLRRLNNG
jgi:hypothetical protein